MDNRTGAVAISGFIITPSDSTDIAEQAENVRGVVNVMIKNLNTTEAVTVAVHTQLGDAQTLVIMPGQVEIMQVRRVLETGTDEYAELQAYY